MAIKNSKFLKSYWSGIPIEKRKEIMRNRAKSRWKLISPEQKLIMMKKLNNARWNKSKIDKLVLG